MSALGQKQTFQSFRLIALFLLRKCFTSGLRIDLYSSVSFCALVKHHQRRSAHRIQAALGVCISPASASCTACAGKVSRDQCPLYPQKRTCAVQLGAQQKKQIHSMARHRIIRSPRSR
jgi:hypothetical protein